MDVDDAGQDEQAARIDFARVGRSWQVRVYGDDAACLHRNIGSPALRGRNDRAAANDQVYGSSSMTMSCAPSPSTRRPISRSCSLPLTIVAK